MASPLTIQPSSEDTSIAEGTATTNYGTDAYLDVRSRATNLDIRSLCEFAITWGTDIPAGAILTSATLSLNYYAKGANDPVGRTIVAARVLRTDWVEAQATWNIYKTGSSWTTVGCGSDGNDYISTGQANSVVPAAYGWMTWNVLTILQACQTAGVNPIFRLKDSVEESATAYTTRFYSLNEAVETALRPKLVIEYTEAGGWTNIAKVNGVTATDLAKVRGIAVADIAKRRGVAV
jgi:hypothetical protein